MTKPNILYKIAMGLTKYCIIAKRIILNYQNSLCFRTLIYILLCNPLTMSLIIIFCWKNLNVDSSGEVTPHGKNWVKFANSGIFSVVCWEIAKNVILQLILWWSFQLNMPPNASFYRANLMKSYSILFWEQVEIKETSACTPVCSCSFYAAYNLVMMLAFRI